MKTERERKKKDRSSRATFPQATFLERFGVNCKELQRDRFVGGKESVTTGWSKNVESIVSNEEMRRKK